MTSDFCVADLLPQCPQWIEGGSKWTGIECVDLDYCDNVVQIFVNLLRGCLGWSVVVGVGSELDDIWDCVVALTFSEGVASREIRIYVSSDPAVKGRVLYPYDLRKDEIYCQSWDEAWYLATGLIQSLKPMELQLAPTLW